jgi:hypothetical protein
VIEMDYKIVQIIPAPNNMFSVYKNPIEEFKCKVVCLALIEYDDGEREIVSMDITDGDAEISKVGQDSSFKCIEFN